MSKVNVIFCNTITFVENSEVAYVSCKNRGYYTFKMTANLKNEIEKLFEEISEDIFNKTDLNK